MKQITLIKAVSIIHNVRFGGLPTHYPSVAAWNRIPLTRKTEASRWKKTLSEYPGRGIGLYLNIPFCRAKCGFCFLDVRGGAGLAEYERYVSAVEAEIAFLSPLFSGRTVSSVYIGGGTPNVLPAFLLKRIVSCVRSGFSLLPSAQISMEANPDFFDEEKLSALHKCGVNMLMLGIQSFSSSVNAANGRVQDVSRIKDVFRMIRSSGIKFLNADLLCGLNGQTRASFLHDVVSLSGLRPNQIHLNRIKPHSGPLPPELKRELSACRTEPAAGAFLRGRISTRSAAVLTALKIRLPICRVRLWKGLTCGPETKYIRRCRARFLLAQGFIYS